ncbi:hypothetical protein VTN77DRAFT_6069 [Rasamsonia byssochlamydoides]|uniref:uncharacterized protein n=1 Tax=Rasamsonia byssochlamydoides TaxID=89139 RepID=UPI0037432C56
MAAARIRRTFRYPDDSEPEPGGREELDEEEQERLIKELRVENEKQNSRYHLAFTILPLITTIAYVPSILSSTATASQRLSSILCILSLFTTAYIMRYVPLQRPDRKDRNKPLSDIGPESPVIARKYLTSLNAALCALLSLVFWNMGGNNREQDQPWPVLYLVPGAVLGIVVIARRTMLDVDIGQLEELRYEYKGA